MYDEGGRSLGSATAAANGQADPSGPAGRSDGNEADGGTENPGLVATAKLVGPGASQDDDEDAKSKQDRELMAEVGLAKPANQAQLEAMSDAVKRQEAGDLAGAIKLLEPLAAAPSANIMLLLLLGDFYVEAGADTQALSMFRRVEGSIGPQLESNVNIHLRIGAVQLKLGQPKEAIPELLQSLHDLDPQNRIVAPLKLAEAFERAGDRSSAHCAILVAISRQPFQPAPWIELNRLMPGACGENGRAVIGSKLPGYTRLRSFKKILALGNPYNWPDSALAKPLRSYEDFAVELERLDLDLEGSRYRMVVVLRTLGVGAINSVEDKDYEKALKELAAALQKHPFESLPLDAKIEALKVEAIAYTGLGLLSHASDPAAALGELDRSDRKVMLPPTRSIWLELLSRAYEQVSFDLKSGHLRSQDPEEFVRRSDCGGGSDVPLHEHEAKAPDSHLQRYGMVNQEEDEADVGSCGAMLWSEMGDARKKLSMLLSMHIKAQKLELPVKFFLKDVSKRIRGRSAMTYKLARPKGVSDEAYDHANEILQKVARASENAAAQGKMVMVELHGRTGKTLLDELKQIIRSPEARQVRETTLISFSVGLRILESYDQRAKARSSRP